MSKSLRRAFWIPFIALARCATEPGEDGDALDGGAQEVSSQVDANSPTSDSTDGSPETVTNDPSAEDGGDEGGVRPSESGRLTAFYLDVGGSVMATYVDEPRARTIVEDAGDGPDGIALDVTNGHLYWTGMGVPSEDDGFIRRANLDGSDIVTIVPEGETYTPKQLKLDPGNGKLYWSDREGMRVMRSNLDGSQLETLVTTGMGSSDRSDPSRWCVGIAVDPERGYVYWSQKGGDPMGEGSLRRAGIDLPDGEDAASRSDVEVLFDGLPEPIDIDLDLPNGRIYWTDRGDDTVNRAPIEIPEGATASDRDDREILVSGVREAIGVTLDLERGKLYFTGGTLGRVGMANLDGSDQVDLLSGSAGLTGIAVASLPQ